jgi:predicted amidophosphoribosyltransferase
VIYDERARRFVRAWKEHGRRRLAAEAAAVATDVIPPPAVDALAYVPGDPERALRRGDVPPRSLAVELGLLWGLPVRDLLRRTQSLPPQRGRSLRERRRNVRGSIAAAGPAPRALCLVDDVYTSGATADACAAALRKAGARRVEVVTMARAVR